MKKITEKQKKVNETFLEYYKALEKTVMEVDECSIFELENQLGQDSEEANRLKICRLMRNFLSHNNNSDGFVSASHAMIAFLDSETKKELKKKKTAGDISKKIRSISEDDSLQECAGRLSRVPFLPVTDKEGKLIGCITAKSICSAFSGSPLNARTKVKAAVSKCGSVLADTPADEVLESCIVTDKNGKYKGVIVI